MGAILPGCNSMIFMHIYIYVYPEDDVKSAVTEMITKTMETDPAQYAEALAAFESCFKDLGESIPTIRV